MKIATGIIGLFLGLLVLLQSCAVTAGSGLANDSATAAAASIGMLVGLVFFIAGAFSFALPLVGAIMFFIAGLLAFPELCSKCHKIPGAVRTTFWL
jgi:L-cysteine desulfidase